MISKQLHSRLQLRMYLTDDDVARIRAKAQKKQRGANGEGRTPISSRKPDPKSDSSDYHKRETQRNSTFTAPVIPVSEWLDGPIGYSLGYNGARFDGSLARVVKPPPYMEEPESEARLDFAYDRGGLLVFQTVLRIIEAVDSRREPFGLFHGYQSRRHINLKYSIARRIAEVCPFAIDYEKEGNYGKADVFVPRLNLAAEAGYCPSRRVISVLRTGDPMLLAPYCAPSMLYLFVATDAGREMAASWQRIDDERMDNAIRSLPYFGVGRGDA
jgi:hypothetical protein